MNHDHSLTRPTADIQPADGATAARRALRFDWLMVGAAFWVVAGLYLDGWAHHHLESSLETFFTPWHLIFYTGLLVNIGALGLSMLRPHAGQVPWYRRVPAGYTTAVLGIPFVVAGGIGDGIWHTLFGIEVDVEALLSPTHLLLAIGIGLFVSGPYRAAGLRRPESAPPTWLSALPALLSVTLTLSLLTFFSQYVHPLAEPWTIMQTPKYPMVPLSVRQELGAASILVSSALLMGSVFFLLRAGAGLPRGGLTLMLGLNTLGMSVFQDQYYLLPGMVLAGVLADALVWWLRPSVLRLSTVRIAALVIPLLVYGSYFAIVALQRQLSWSIHLWGGTLVLASITGWMLSHAMLPAPARPTAQA